MADTLTSIHINGVDLAVTRHGAGTPLIWGHGLMGSMATEDLGSWFQWDRLAAGATIVRYDARGHGQSGASDSPGDYTWANLAKDMLGLADHLEIARFVAGGMSMGSGTAINAALAAPERIAGLILMTPPTAWATRAGQTAMYEQMAALVESQGAAALAALFAQQAPALYAPLMLESTAGFIPFMSDYLASFDPATLSNVLRGAGRTDLPPREQIRTIAAPTLILAWEGDRGHPIATAEELAALLPNAQAHIARSAQDLAQWPQLMADFLRARGAV